VFYWDVFDLVICTSIESKIPKIDIKCLFFFDLILHKTSYIKKLLKPLLRQLLMFWFFLINH